MANGWGNYLSIDVSHKENRVITLRGTGTSWTPAMDCSLQGSSVCGILQARMLEWVAMPSSRGSSQQGD